MSLLHVVVRCHAAMLALMICFFINIFWDLSSFPALYCTEAVAIGWWFCINYLRFTPRSGSSYSHIRQSRVHKFVIRVRQGLVAFFIRQNCKKEIVSTIFTAFTQVVELKRINRCRYTYPGFQVTYKPGCTLLNHFNVTSLVLEDRVSHWWGIFNKRTTQSCVRKQLGFFGGTMKSPFYHT